MQDNGRHQEEDAGHEAGEGQCHGQAGSTINILHVLAKKNCKFCFARNEMRLKFLFRETVCSCLGGRWQQLPHEPPIPFIAVSPSHEAGEAA